MEKINFEKILDWVKAHLVMVLLSIIALLAGGIFYYVSHSVSADKTISSSALTSVSADRNFDS